MSRHALLVGAATAAVFAFPAAATAQIVKISHILPKAGFESDIGNTRIVVTGATENKYDKVVTTSLEAWVSVSAPDKPPRDKDKLGGQVMVDGQTVLNVAAGFASSPTIYRISFPYRDPRSYQVANQRVSPIALCNDKLASLSGAARESFRNEGGFISRTNAYIATADQAWRVRKQGSAFDEIKGWQDAASIPVVVDCRRLTGPKVRTTSTTQGSGAVPKAKKVEPTLAKVTLRGEPQAWQTIGGQSCPTKVRLYGFVEVNRAFDGRAIFLGPAFLTPLQNLQFAGPGTRTLTATYDAKWPTGPVGLAASGPKPAPRTQQVTLRMNVADAGGKVLKTAQTTETLTCRIGAAPTRIRN